MLRGLLVSRLLVSLAAGDSDGLDALARCVHNAWVLELGPDTNYPWLPLNSSGSSLRVQNPACIPRAAAEGY